jgi:arylsulfatase A-like enzyme
MDLPNILALHSHDTRRYVQPYGYAVPTPNIQRLAEQGILFRQAFCAGPTCSPSRAALLTGQSPHSCGMIGLAHRGFRLRDYGHHLVQVLGQEGYTTTLCGGHHEAPWPGNEIGYHRVLPSAHIKAEAVSQAACEFLESRPPGPFFLSVGFFETHREFRPPSSPQVELYCQPPAPLPDAPQTRRDMAGFLASAKALDRGMGAVLESLDRAGLADNTLVICTADHGIAFPFMKCNLTDHGLGVMLILRGPGGFAGGKVCDAMVSHIDVFPTFCEMLAMDAPARLEGRSLMPLVCGQADEVNEEIFGEVTYHAAYEPMRAVRTKRWKYIRRFGDRTRPVLPNIDDSPSKTLLVECGLRERPTPREELYDLVYDPHEVCNLVDDAAHSAKGEEMRRRLDAWMRRTCDPLLKGPVPAPSGALYNDPDGLSPVETPLRAP